MRSREEIEKASEVLEEKWKDVDKQIAIILTSNEDDFTRIKKMLWDAQIELRLQR